MANLVYTAVEVKAGDTVNHRKYGLLKVSSLSESGKTAFGLNIEGREKAFTPSTEYLITEAETIVREDKKRTKQIIRKYVNKQAFQTFVEYLKDSWYDLRVETSNPSGFESEYKQRLNQEITLPDSAIQENKWGTQIRLNFIIPQDLSLIPFEEAPSGAGGSYSRMREVWINKGKGNGEITNYWFNWELRESGLLFNFESQEEITENGHNS